MDSIIFPTQTSFIPSRRGSNNIFSVQEAIHSLRNKKGKKGFCALKIDLEKAYDKLEWSFIREALNYFDFLPLLSHVIMKCISSSRMAILINGSPSEWIIPSRGIRQGDPISPYIFLLCMEYLSLCIEKAVQQGSWETLKVCRGGLAISHCMFADDIILFSSCSNASISEVKSILENFCLKSGLTISLEKSSLLLQKY